MRFYALREPPRRHGAEIDACHRWFVPGVVCDICNRTWTTTGVAYPTLEIPEDLDAVIPRRPIARRDFSRLVPQLRERLGIRLPLPPGTEFGPLVGTLCGAPAHLQWQNAWTLLVSTPALTALAWAGVQVRTAPAALKPTCPDDVLHEIEIRPNGYLHAPEYRKPRGLPCASCGYEQLERPDRVVLKGATVSRDADVFRVTDFPTIIVASERFVTALVGDGFEAEEVTLA